jgi:type I restriction enzyme S subunit
VTEWVRAQLADVCEIVGRGITPNYDDNGDVIVLNQKCIRDGRVDFSLARSHGGRPVQAQKILHGGEVLVNSTGVGTLGRTAAVPPIDQQVTVDSHITIVRSGGSDPGWLRYLFRSLEPSIEALSEGSTGQTELNRHLLGKIAVVAPPLSEQRAIAGVLGALDDKIESNRRISENLRQLIKTEWDVAKDESWPVKSLSSLATFVNGGAFTKGATGSGRMVIRIAELNSGPGSSTIYNELDVPDEKLARPGDILMSWSGSLGVYIWARDEAIINQHIFKVIPDEYPAWLVFNCLNEALPFFRQTASDKATTMGHIQRHHLDDAQVQVPLSGSLNSLDLVMKPMWQRMILSEVEALELADLRDSLLPELLSGRLRVSDVEKAVEEVV